MNPRFSSADLRALSHDFTELVLVNAQVSGKYATFADVKADVWKLASKLPLFKTLEVHSSNLSAVVSRTEFFLYSDSGIFTLNYAETRSIWLSSRE
jgi:hypothetical protein